MQMGEQPILSGWGNEMNAIVKFADGAEGFGLREVDCPRPSDGELLVRVLAAGVCGTDLHIVHDEYPHIRPIVLGHEFTGIVEALGGAASGFSVGDQVVSLTQVETCGVCRHCRNGVYMLCDARKSIGSRQNGAMAEYLVIPAHTAYKVPPHAAGAAMVLCEPAACALRGVLERSPIRAGDVCVVSGPGIIGQLTAQMAKLAGAQVILSGLPGDRERLELAASLGIADHICWQPEALQELVRAQAPEGADIVFEAAGAVASLNACLTAVRKGGHFGLLGVFGREITFRLDTVREKELTFSVNTAAARSSWDRLMQLIGQGQLVFAPYLTHTFRLEEWRQAFRAAEEKTVYKAVLIP